MNNSLQQHCYMCKGNLDIPLALAVCAKLDAYGTTNSSNNVPLHTITKSYNKTLKQT